MQGPLHSAGLMIHLSSKIRTVGIIMRAVLQRVRKGAVRVDGETVGAIDHGFVILVGVGHDDGEDEARWLARKIAGLRVFEDAAGQFNLSLQDVGGGCLIVR
jgi:D-tyrosyl-tRNA(Tyr) deacylase